MEPVESAAAILREAPEFADDLKDDIVALADNAFASVCADPAAFRAQNPVAFGSYRAGFLAAAKLFSHHDKGLPRPEALTLLTRFRES